MQIANCKLKIANWRIAFTLHSALCTLHFALPPAEADQSLDRATNAEISTELDPHWLEAARHPQTGLLSRNIRPEEANGYFAILNHARRVPLARLKSVAKEFQQERLPVVKRDPNFQFYFRKPDAEFPTFVDLYRHPDMYHGKLVTFRGHVRRLVSFPAGENAHGFQQLHEAWLYVDGAQQNPVVVVCSELPPNIPTGTDILVDFVSATGYFFKRYGYEDRTGESRFAPLILAQRLEWTPVPKRSELFSSERLFGLTIFGAAVVAAFWWRHLRQRRWGQRTAADLPNPFTTDDGA